MVRPLPKHGLKLLVLALPQGVVCVKLSWKQFPISSSIANLRHQFGAGFSKQLLSPWLILYPPPRFGMLSPSTVISWLAKVLPPSSSPPLLLFGNVDMTFFYSNSRASKRKVKTYLSRFCQRIRYVARVRAFSQEEG